MKQINFLMKQTSLRKIKILHKRNRERESPLHLPHEGECTVLVLGRVGLVGLVRGLNLRQVGPVWLVREPKLSTPPYGGGGEGLKISIIFLLFSSHKRHKSSHKRERANNPAFLSTNILIASADTIRAPANRIRKPADTIRKLTKRYRRILGKIRPKMKEKLWKTALPTTSSTILSNLSHQKSGQKLMQKG